MQNLTHSWYENSTRPDARVMLSLPHFHVILLTCACMPRTLVQNAAMTAQNAAIFTLASGLVH